MSLASNQSSFLLSWLVSPPPFPPASPLSSEFFELLLFALHGSIESPYRAGMHIFDTVLIPATTVRRRDMNPVSISSADSYTWSMWIYSRNSNLFLSCKTHPWALTCWSEIQAQSGLSHRISNRQLDWRVWSDKTCWVCNSPGYIYLPALTFSRASSMAFFWRFWNHCHRMKVDINIKTFLHIERSNKLWRMGIMLSASKRSVIHPRESSTATMWWRIL